MTISQFFANLIGSAQSLDNKVIVEYQYMNWDSGEKNKTEMPIYGAEFKDGKLIIKCGEE